MVRHRPAASLPRHGALAPPAAVPGRGQDPRAAPWPFPSIRRDAFDDSCSVPSRPPSAAPASVGAGAGHDADAAVRAAGARAQREHQRIHRARQHRARSAPDRTCGGAVPRPGQDPGRCREGA
ncbi:hypothetical protein G6F65_019931 [Rhizopus arrhizus]|nr:hypothetical protein G6F65_019931 [Rhizopus arrhizus]